MRRLKPDQALNGEKKNVNGRKLENQRQCQKNFVVINILQMICMGDVLEALGSYQQTLIQKLE